MAMRTEAKKCGVWAAESLSEPETVNRGAVGDKSRMGPVGFMNGTFRALVTSEQGEG